MPKEVKDMITVKQNIVTNDILRYLNCIRDIDENDTNALGDYEVETNNGCLQMDVKYSQLNKMQRKLRYPNVKKLFLYIGYRLNSDKKREVSMDINEFLDFKEQTKRTENVRRAIEDLRLLKNIKISNFNNKTKNGIQKLEESFLLKCEDTFSEDKSYSRMFYINIGKWSQSLIENNHYSFIPREIFTFNKLEFDIAYNIIFRLINEKSKLPEQNNTFSLSVKSLIKNVELNISKIGSTKMIDEIEAVLNKLQGSDWFKWDYRNNDRSTLPDRNKFIKYKRFMIDFNMSESLIIQ